MTGRVLIRCPDCRRFARPEARVCRCGRRLRLARLRAWWIEWRGQRRNARGHRLRQTECIGPSTTREAAEARLAEVLTAQTNGRHLPGRLNRHRTLGQLIAWYLDRPDVQARRSYPDIASKLRNVERTLGGGTPIEALSRAVDGFCEVRRGEGRAAAQINRETSNLRALIAYSARRGWIDHDPVRRWPRLAERERVRVLDAAEETALLDACIPGGEILRDLVILLRYTGMRTEEALNLRHGEIDAARRVARLPPERAKEGAPKTIPLVIAARDGTPIAHAWDAVERRVGAVGADRVFHGGPATRSAFYHAFKGIAARAELKDLRPHDLRRTFCVWMVLELGYAERAVMAITGHRTRVAFDRYRIGRAREAMSVMPAPAGPPRRDPVVELFLRQEKGPWTQSG